MARMDRGDPGRPGEISLAAAGAIRARLGALRDGRLPRPAELLGIEAHTLFGRFTAEGAFTNTMAEPALAALAHEH
jgi:hypothetical protein